MNSLLALCAALALGQVTDTVNLPAVLPRTASSTLSTRSSDSLGLKLGTAEIQQATFSPVDFPFWTTTEVVSVLPQTKTGSEKPGVSTVAGTTGTPEEPVGEPQRRALPAPLLSPPFPSADYQGSPPIIGIPVGPPAFPLMQALQGSWYGTLLNDNRINVYGWIDVGGNASNSRNSNVPLSYNVTPNSVQLDQAILRFERVPDSVQIDRMDWGFRFTNLYGIDYRYTTAKGYLSEQLLNHNNLYGYDPLEIYGLIYVPWIAQGMIVK